MATEEKGLVIATPGGKLVPDWWADAYGPATMFVTTLDKSKPADRKQLLSALQDNADASADWINRDLRMVGYTMSPAQTVRDGEVQQWVRCVIHLEGGKNVAFGSLGIVKSLMLIQQLDRPAPWNPPLVKRLVSRLIGEGKHWLSLVDPE